MGTISSVCCSSEKKHDDKKVVAVKQEKPKKQNHKKREKKIFQNLREILGSKHLSVQKIICYFEPLWVFWDYTPDRNKEQTEQVFRFVLKIYDEFPQGIKQYHKDLKPTSEILNAIIPHHYQNLTQLTLSSLNLTSLETLSFLSAPNLSYLRIGQNPITSLKSFGKCAFKCLSLIHVKTPFLTNHTVSDFVRVLLDVEVFIHIYFGQQTLRRQKLGTVTQFAPLVKIRSSYATILQKGDQSTFQQSLIKKFTGRFGFLLFFT